MSDSVGATDAASERRTWFTTTHWSVVLNARDLASPLAAEALEKLCRSYWYPLYAYLRRKGLDQHFAEDITQGFFERLLAKNYLGQVEREKGKFRSFLLASLNHFLADEGDKARAKKRGGDAVHLSLDATDGESRYCQEPADGLDPEKLYERRWALTVIEAARSALEEEYRKGGKAELLERLRPYESGDKGAPPYSALAAELGMSEPGARSAVFRLRKRYRELVREQVAQTVASPEEVDEELRYLIQVLC